MHLCPGGEGGRRRMALLHTPSRGGAQAFWMCMSVIEGGIYFDELVQLPSSHLTLLLLGLILALLGAVGMG